MRFKSVFTCLVLLYLSGASFGQQAPGAEQRRRYVVFPPENVLVTVASQPDCPLQLEDAKLFYDVGEKRLAVGYQLRNRGAKPLNVKSYAVAAWYSEGGGWTSGQLGRDGLMPGQVISENEPFDEVPLTDEWRDKLNLRGGMRQVVVLMIERVEYADGSSYNRRPLSEALAAYFGNMEQPATQRK